MLREREFLIFAGAPRSGKTFYAKKIADNYGRVIVYNIAKETDFPGYKEISFPGFPEVRSRMDKKERIAHRVNPEHLYFSINGEQFPAKRINKVLKNGKYFVFRMHGEEESAFFRFCFLNLSDTLLIIDDARPIFRTMDRNKIELFSKLNHTGRLSSMPALRGKGLDVIAIFHNLDRVNEELYDYATKLVMFRSTRLPDPGRMANDYLYGQIELKYNQLLVAPKYSKKTINLKNSR